MLKRKYKDSSCLINKIEITDSKISGRGGLLPILRYIENTKFFDLVESVVGFLRSSKKGKAVSYIIRQIVAYFIDGSMKAISGFDRLRDDAGYAAIMEVEQDNLLSSHSVKRFFRKFSLARSFLFRRILNALFIWRLGVSRPSVILLDLDTMVLDNDDAKEREGVSPTYKNKKGFQPLQISWQHMIIDALFRRGSSHSNHGNDVVHIVKRVVDLIRKKYSQSVPIILTCDSGFPDQKNLEYFEKKLGILFICYGKLYDTVKDYVLSSPPDNFREYSNSSHIWQYLEFGSKLKSWKRCGFLRTIFTRLVSDEDGQMIIDFARPDSVIYTNIGSAAELTENLVKSGHSEYMSCEKIIAIAHGRGKTELNHRSFKEFITSETLPFKRFGMNAAYYYLMLISHFLYESYKEDIVNNIVEININCYPSTFRRLLIDFASKVASTGNYIKFQIMQGVWKNLNFDVLWERCNAKQLIPVSSL